LKTNNEAVLNGQTIRYTLKRSNRRQSIGLKIDHRGLSINIPQQVPLTHIETVLQEKADWITQKLKLWDNKQKLLSNWTADNEYPLLSEPWILSSAQFGEFVMVRKATEQSFHPSIHALHAEQIEKIVMHWYYQQATACFNERIQYYAQKLHLPKPIFRLSRAKTNWGSCTNRGVIHLNWRLIQLPLRLVDYVVAHELCHLIEMNHSQAFWALVEDTYADYLSARKELNKLSLR